MKLNDIIAARKSKYAHSIFKDRMFKGEMATREDKDLVSAIQHLNVAVDKLKSAASHGDEKAERLLGGMWFHRVLNKGGVRC
jgi:hypothetical protein